VIGKTEDELKNKKSKQLELSVLIYIGI